MKARASHDYRPIGDYGIIGDGHTAALIARDGSVDWFCFPRFDSAAVFCRLLDSAKGGYFRVGPAKARHQSRSYIGATNVLATIFTAPDGRFRLTDFMPIRDSTSGAEHQPRIVRQLEGISGTPEVEIRFAPTFNYARDATKMTLCDGGVLARSDRGASVLLSCPGKFALSEAGAVTRLRLREGERIWMTLGTEVSAGSFTPSAGRANADLKHTLEFWERWSAECTYRGPYHQLVQRSALVLKLLVYQPTGAVIAAPTTSLPEAIGGGGNWDYRYAWLRDSALILDALELTGYHQEAMRFFDWLEHLCVRCDDGLRVLYNVDGEADLREETLDHLDGYRASRPVRVGNAAAGQLQLDAYGQLIDAVFVCHERLPRRIHPDLWQRLQHLADRAAARWSETDRGPWEVRSDPRHFVYSKLLCWVALDRALRIAERRGENGDHISRWRLERERVRDAILDEGYNEELGAFTYAFDWPVLDASALAIPLMGFLPATDRRMRSTVARIREHLSIDGLLYRNCTEDLRGEGTFSLCSFWLVENLALAGDIDEAKRLFERIVAHANDLGLLAEEIDPHTGDLLGNFPQGFTHLALIRAAVRIAHAEHGRA